MSLIVGIVAIAITIWMLSTLNAILFELVKIRQVLELLAPAAGAAHNAVVAGNTKDIEGPKIPCRNCNGTGTVKDMHNPTCPRCKGTGRVSAI